MMRAWSLYSTNGVPRGNVYPQSGDTTGSYAGAQTPQSQAGVGTASAEKAANAPDADAGHSGLLGQPIAGWVLLLVLFVGLMYVGQKYGEDDDFASIKPSFFNVIFVTFTVVLGLGFLKPVASKARDITGLRGVSSLILAA